MAGGKYCCVCKNNYSKDPQISLHRFLSAIDKRGPWLEAFGLREEEVKPHMSVFQAFLTLGVNAQRGLQ